MHWCFEAFRKYSVFDGRARRKEYWMFLLFNFIIAFILTVVEEAVGMAPENGQGSLTTVYSLVVLLPALSVGVRRLHDTGRSGWWLLMSFIPVIGWAIYLIFMLQDSYPGENQYGPNPKLEIMA